MSPAGPFRSDGYSPSSSGARESIHSESRNHLRTEIPVFADTPTQARNMSTTKWPSAAKAFFQRTMARLCRQPKRASQYGLPSPPGTNLTKEQGTISPPDTSSRLTGRDGFASLTHLVLRGANDVSFSPSSFFQRVEEVRALGSSIDAPLVSTLPFPPLQPPPRLHRRPPPLVDEASAQAMPRRPSSSRNYTPTRAKAQTTPLTSSIKAGFDSVLELQAVAVELDKLDPLLVNSAYLAPHQLHASPSINSPRPRSSRWSASSSAAPSLGCDPLAELLAVADELKTMKDLDSDDILYMTDAPPLSPFPPTLHAFLDTPGASLRVLEMDVHREDETYHGVPIPCIVVTSEGEPHSLTTKALDAHIPAAEPSEDLLAPPLTTYRGRIEPDQTLIISHDRERGPPSPPLPPCEIVKNEEKCMGGSPSPPCDLSGCSLVDGSVSWEVVGTVDSSVTSIQYGTKPDRPAAPKPAPLLRRREHSLLRRMLRSSTSDGGRAPLVDKKPRCTIRIKEKRTRISKEVIGSPRQLLPTCQAATVLPLYALGQQRTA
ncbi:hypothetical protein BC826DRAFT_597113 [Russula brevipes]|nr:hypothetical protein BC826DRAFT_597113 [Russula brevipes]